ncbi:MAG: hypothetical protein H7831_03150 [Magnetococcus sp. WYHC-3]
MSEEPSKLSLTKLVNRKGRCRDHYGSNYRHRDESGRKLEKKFNTGNANKKKYIKGKKARKQVDRLEAKDLGLRHYKL